MADHTVAGHSLETASGHTARSSHAAAVVVSQFEGEPFESPRVKWFLDLHVVEAGPGDGFAASPN